jgi:GAF domain-containing protein
MDSSEVEQPLDPKLDALYRLGQALILLRDEQQIMDTVLEIAEEVLDFQDSEFLLVDKIGGTLQVKAQRGELDLGTGRQLPLNGPAGITVYAAQSGQPVYIPDVRNDPRYVNAGFPAVSELAVPVQMKGQVLGVINVESQDPDAYSEHDARLLSTLASQAALALENARLYALEHRRAEEMAAVNRVTNLIRSSLDLRETLDTVVDAASELVPCSLAEISLWDQKREMLTLQALRCGQDRDFPIGESFPPGDGYTGWVVRHRQPLLVPETESRQDIQPDLLPDELPFRSYVGLPLLTGDDLIGTLVLVHDEPDAFGEDDVQLLGSLAGQAAAAIRNASLYEELARHHREHAALYAVAEAANRPLDLQELLHHALDRVIEVTGAKMGAIRLLDHTAQQLVLAAHRGLSEAYALDQGQVPLTEEIVGWVARTGKPTISEDMWADPRVSPRVRELLREEGHRSLAQVPLLAQEKVVGTLGLAAGEPGFFKADDLVLLDGIGQQLGMAIANAQLFEETQRKARELAALNAVAVAINQALDLETLLRSGLERAMEVVGADSGAVRVLDLDSNSLELVCSQGVSAGYAAEVQSLPLGYRVAGRVAQTGEPALYSDVKEDMLTRAFITDTLMEENPRALAVVPLHSRERVVGTLGIGSQTPGAFGPADVDLLIAIGHQLGVAIENARLRQQSLEAERLAAVGRVAGTVAHELRSPLGGIMRSAEFLARPELSDTTRQELSRAIVAMSRRLINTAQEILDFTRGGKMALQMVRCNLPEFLDEMLDVLRVDFSDRGIEVATRWEYAGDARMDPDRMAQVVYNIASNARDAMSEGGQLTVTTLKTGKWVELRFSDSGPGVPPELAERIFEPFFSHGKREGAGLGLAIAQRIIQEHKGEIKVESPAEGGADFVVRIPAGD